jgi:hypothetical protein
MGEIIGMISRVWLPDIDDQDGRLAGLVVLFRLSVPKDVAAQKCQPVRTKSAKRSNCHLLPRRGGFDPKCSKDHWTDDFGMQRAHSFLSALDPAQERNAMTPAANTTVLLAASDNHQTSALADMLASIRPGIPTIRFGDEPDSEPPWVAMVVESGPDVGAVSRQVRERSRDDRSTLR